MRVTNVCAKAGLTRSGERKISGFYVHSQKNFKEEEFDYSRGFLYNQWTRREKIIYVNV
jgi:hypothetical protein